VGALETLGLFSLHIGAVHPFALLGLLKEVVGQGAQKFPLFFIAAIQIYQLIS
jgi:hypothetical protein